MAAKLGKDEPRPVRIVEDAAGLSLLLADRVDSEGLSRRSVYVHLAVMVGFITVGMTVSPILALPVWAIGGVNILMSAQRASWQIHCTSVGVELGRLYTRGEPGEGDIRGVGKGPYPFGLGQRDDAVTLPFSEMKDIGWSDESLTFDMGDTIHELVLDLTTPADIEGVGRRLKEVHQRYLDGLTQTHAEAESTRRRLAALDPQRR
jgi:hypothetical protein